MVGWQRFVGLYVLEGGKETVIKKLDGDLGKAMIAECYQWLDVSWAGFPILAQSILPWKTNMEQAGAELCQAQVIFLIFDLKKM